MRAISIKESMCVKSNENREQLEVNRDVERPRKPPSMQNLCV